MRYVVRRGLERALMWSAIFPLLGLQAANAQSGVPVKFDVASICEVVEKMQVVDLKYNHDPDTAPVRRLHPYAVGYTPSRKVLLFGLQVDGYSQSAQSNSTKGWRNFRTDKIKSLTKFDSKFDPVRPELPDRKIIAEYACKNKMAQ